jgi:hypothetical protein
MELASKASLIIDRRQQTMNNDSYDLLTEVHKIKTKPIIDVVYQWVEGHQVDATATITWTSTSF